MTRREETQEKVGKAAQQIEDQSKRITALE